jgi:hypothetical protein
MSVWEELGLIVLFVAGACLSWIIVLWSWYTHTKLEDEPPKPGEQFPAASQAGGVANREPREIGDSRRAA